MKYSRRLKLFSPCINSEFRQILSHCHCQVLLFKRSFLLILYFLGGGAGPRLELPRGGKRNTAPLGTPLCLAWGREMQADVILKEPPPWMPPLSLSGGARVEGAWRARPPLSYATQNTTLGAYSGRYPIRHWIPMFFGTPCIKSTIV